MIVIAALIIGAALGARVAKKRGGATADILQYAAVYAIASGILGTILTILIDRFFV
jgi:prolipoprotein diacylglyceryltransferase